MRIKNDFNFQRWQHCNAFVSIRFKNVFSGNKTWTCGLLVQIVGSRDVIFDEYCRACCSNAFDLHTTITVQILIFYALYGSPFDWQFSPKEKKTNKLSFLDKLNSGKCCTSLFVSDNLPPTCRNIRKLVPLDGFSQTGCLRMLFYFNNNLRQSVTILRELAPLEKTFTDKLSNRFNKDFK